jgi:Transposase DDE domain group 1
VRLRLLFALAYNLANSLRSLTLPDEVARWSLSTLREKPVKIGVRIVRHGRHVVFQLAEMAVPRALFAAILRRIDRLRRLPVAEARPERTMRAAGAEGKTMRRGLRKIVESPRALPRSGPASLMPPVTASPAAFRLTSRPSRSTVELSSGGHRGDVG